MILTTFLVEVTPNCRTRPLYARVAKAPCPICDAGHQKTDAAQRASHDLHRQTSSRSQSFTEAKLTVSIKVMVLPQPNAKSIPCTPRPQMYCKLQH